MRYLRLIPLSLLLLGCESKETESDAVEPAASEMFWASLQELCGQAFEGTIVESVPADTSLTGKTLTMHVRSCEDAVIRIPFFVGDDRSRTWVISKTETGLRLKHDHRHEDGSEDEVTQYGGDTNDPGTGTKQEFPADQFTAELLPVSATNIWTIEILPGEMFAYALRREGSERRFRAQFDLTNPVDEPLPPWGW